MKTVTITVRDLQRAYTWTLTSRRLALQSTINHPFLSSDLARTASSRRPPWRHSL